MSAIAAEGLPLFAPHSGSPTSKAAARAIAPHRATLKARVFAAIAICGAEGATDEEVQDALGMPGNTERPRRGELVDKGFIVAAPFTRKTRAGLDAVVYVVAKRGAA